MKGLSKTTQYAIFSLIFFLVSVSIAAFSYYYVDSEGRELEAKMEVVSKNRELQQHYTSLQVLVNASQEEFKELKSYLLTEGNTINFLSEIETLAGDMKLKLTTDALEVGQLSSPNFQSISLRLRVSGKQGNMIDFLRTLETLPYYSRIESLSLEKVGDRGDWAGVVTLLVGLHSND